MFWIILLALAGAAVLAVLWAWLVERHWFALRRHRVECLPPGSAPLRILHVSDLHYRANLSSMNRFLDRLRSVSPDLIVGTGDFLGDDSSVEELARRLGEIPSRNGGVFVLGSNDYYLPVPKNPMNYLRRKPRKYRHGPPNGFERFVEGLESGGWRLLLNKVVTVDGMEITGLDDPHIKRHDWRVTSKREPGDERFRLAVIHSPDIAADLAKQGYDLIVAGHTHGGQLRVPGYGALVTNTQNLPRRMARGLHRIGDAWLHVSAGMGTSKYAPVRFSCRPEACILELVPRSS